MAQCIQILRSGKRCKRVAAQGTYRTPWVAATGRCGLHLTPEEKQYIADEEAATVASARARRERDPICWSWTGPDLATLDPTDPVSDWQDERCGICGSRSALVLDHDHVTNLVRGWLCRSCNVNEGRSDGPTDMFARWRACPAAAIVRSLDLYGAEMLMGDYLIEPWTGFTYLPEGSPDPGSWPHGFSCGVAPEAAVGEWALTFNCRCPHPRAARPSITPAHSVPVTHRLAAMLEPGHDDRSAS